MAGLVKNVKLACQRLGIVGQSGLVAVSGGADSVALLRLLNQMNPGQLAVGHFQHHLRGEESLADEQFVRQLADQLGLPFYRGEALVRQLAAGQNLEAVARKLRYEWLASVARQSGSVWVATGHNADDQAETVLHRILRGTGIAGLTGIAPERELDAGVRLVRPILEVSRSEIVEYLSAIGQLFREDSSNQDRQFTRNRLRHDLLPLLKNYQPDLVRGLCQLAEQATTVNRYLNSQADRLLAEAELPRAEAVVVLKTAVLLAQPDLVCELFRRVWLREGWPSGGMTYRHWQRLVSVTNGELPTAEFPDGVVARRVGQVLQLYRRKG